MGESMTNSENARFCDLRRRVIAAKFSRLNEMQQQAVLSTEGPLLILAGAGSGKTTVLIHRIANLITFGAGSDSREVPPYVTADDLEFLEHYAVAPNEEERCRAEQLCALRRAEPWNILAITFTNKAANQLKERLAAMLGPAAQDVWAMTFHAACCRILRREIHRLGYDSSFNIFDTADSQHVAKEAMAQLNLDEKSLPIRRTLTLISRAKDNMQSPEDMAAEAARSCDFQLEQVARVYEEYQQRLRRANALDFDDIILLTVRLLEQYSEVREYYRQKFRYVLIDEYQDTNRLQYRLATLLTGAEQNICVVGDDDQSIYKFRGATIENILDFDRAFSGCRTIRLEENYRSTQRILDGANAVIRNNRGRKGKTLWTQNGQGEKIRVFEAEDEQEEARFVAEKIFRHRETGSFRDCAVLYRTNAQSNALERAFQYSGVPYRIIGGHRFFDRAEVKDMLAYLYFLNNTADDFHLLRIINNPPRGIGGKTLEMAERQCAAANCPLYSIVSNARMYPSMEKAAAKLGAFTELTEACQEALMTLPLPEFYDVLLEKTGYLAYLEGKNDTENLVRAENVRELRSSLVTYVQNTDTPTLSGFLQEVSLFTDIEKYDENADAAVMMTVHSAKGLEFPLVCLVGMEENLFPGSAAADSDEELEEERRLCYVGITRAMKSLVVTYARHRMLFGRTTFSRRSRFVDELPEDVVTGRPAARTFRSAFDDFSQEPQSDWSAPAKPPVKKPTNLYSTLVSAKSAAPALSLRQGDMVRHKVFGRGLVLTVLPMGNDALLEIAFDDVGTKKLMAGTAARHMVKE